MKFKQGQIIHTQSIPLLGWYLRWIPWVISGFACVGYLSGVLTTQPLTLLSLLLLTGTYGAWLVIYHLGVQRFEVRAHPCWALALFCLDCASHSFATSRSVRHMFLSVHFSLFDTLIPLKQEER